MEKKDQQIYDEIFRKYRPTLKTMIVDMVYSAFLKRNQPKKSIYDDNKELRFRSKEIENIDLEYIAIVIDGVAKEAIRLDKKTAAMLLSKYATLVPFDPEKTGIILGAKYINGEFIKDNND